MKVVVTGGGGFIGAFLVKKLVKLGHDVVVIDNFLRGSLARLKPIEDKISLINLDITKNFEIFLRETKDVDAIFHLAAVNGTENFYNHPSLVLDVGVYGILNVLNAAEVNSIKKVIVASSAEVYQTAKKIPTDESAELIIPDPLEPRYSYASSKIITEQLTLSYAYSGRIESGIVFRPHNVYGPDMGTKHVVPQFILRAKDIREKGYKCEFEMFGSGEETRAFCYVDDIVDGLIILLNGNENKGIFHIGNDHEISINELFFKLNSYFDNKLIKTHRDGAKGATKRRCPSISKMRNLGYDPKIDIDQGLKKTIEFYEDFNPDNDNQLL